MWTLILAFRPGGSRFCWLLLSQSSPVRLCVQTKPGSIDIEETISCTGIRLNSHFSYSSCEVNSTTGDVGFIGFKFNNGSGDQYGWVRIKMGQCYDNDFWLIDYAYADPGEPIRAGQTSSNEMVPEESNEMVPDEGSLAASRWEPRGSWHGVRVGHEPHSRPQRDPEHS